MLNIVSDIVLKKIRICCSTWHTDPANSSFYCFD